MIGARIEDGDVLIVDCSRKPENSKVVIAILDGAFIVRRLRIQNGYHQLEAENTDYPVLSLSNESGLKIWGVVTGIMRSLDDFDMMSHLFAMGGKA